MKNTFEQDAELLFAIENEANVLDESDLIGEIESYIFDIVDSQKAKETMVQLYRYNSMNSEELEQQLIIHKVKVSENYSVSDVLKTQKTGSNIFKTRQKSRELYSAIVKLVYSSFPERYNSISEIEAAVRYYEVMSYFNNFCRTIEKESFDSKISYGAFLIGVWTTYAKMIEQLGEERISSYLHSLVSRKHKKKSLDDCSEEVELARSAWDAGCKLTHDQMATLLGEVQSEADYIYLKKELKKVAPPERVFGTALCKRKELSTCPCAEKASICCSINKINTDKKSISVSPRKK